MTAAETSSAAANRVGVGTDDIALGTSSMSQPHGGPGPNNTWSGGNTNLSSSSAGGSSGGGVGPTMYETSRSGTPGSRPDMLKAGTSGGSQPQSREPGAEQQQGWGSGTKDWRDMDARSAPFTTEGPKSAGGVSQRGPSPNPQFGFHSSPPKSQSASSGEQSGPTLAAPRAMPPYPRFTSPQPPEGAERSPSPSKRGAFTFGGDARERWASIGQTSAQAQQSGPSQQGLDGGRKSGMLPPGQGGNGGFGGEGFLGYNDIWGSGPKQSSSDRSSQTMGGGSSGPLSTSDPSSVGGQGSSSNPSRAFSLPSSHPELEPLNTRFDPSSGFSGRDEGPYSALPNGVGRPGDEQGGRFPFNMPPGMSGVPSSGSLSPRSLLHYHQQQVQAQQAMAMQTAQHGPPPQSGLAMMSGGPSSEEITTVFIVGFPDDMTEREFANMFLFARGFEASTLKIPAGNPTSAVGPGQRPENGPLSGPGGPYNAVNMPGAGLFDLAGNGPPGGWDEHSLSLALSRAGANEGYSSINNMGGLGGALQGLGNSSNQAAAGGAIGPGGPGGPGGKIKQIIGFAKFRTRAEALEARDALNGRKIDAERGCVLKTEMAKKNLHTKQRPILTNANPSAGEGSFGGPLSAGPPPPGGSHNSSTQSGPGFSGMSGGTGNINEREGNFSRGRPEGQQHPGGPHGFGSGFGGHGGPPPPPPSHGAFDPFQPGGPGMGGNPTNGLISPGEYGRNGNNGGDFFGSRQGPPLGAHRFGQEGSQGSEPGTRSGEAKWPTMGPIDFYDTPQGQQQRPPSAPQGAQRSQPSSQVPPPGLQPPQGGNNAPPRGPDWSALGSPTGLYASARGSEFGSQKTGSAGALSPFGEQPPTSTGGSTGLGGGPQEDFWKGESTATGQARSHQSPPPTGSEKSNGIVLNDDGESKSPGAAARASSKSQTKPRSRATSPVSASSVAHRFGSLRIDSPNTNVFLRHQQQFSHHLQQQFNQKSQQQHPSQHQIVFGNPDSVSPPLLTPSDRAPSRSAINPSTSPTSPDFYSPTLDAQSNLPSPTSRSFSIDQNPPGNTLFVGNLPGSITSPPSTIQLEEALHHVFSSKSGFRQMSFRVKSSGPMCFVEFDDVGWAGRALGEVNGDTLDGLVKNGGLRLSFSKNPLFKGSVNSTSNSPNPGGHQNGEKNAVGTVKSGDSGSSKAPQLTRDLLNLDNLSGIEETAYREGFTDGHSHGELHGTFEGRDLGCQKGFEIWEEVGFYEGMTHFWLDAIKRMAPIEATRTRKQVKQLQHLSAFESLISTFPMANNPIDDSQVAEAEGSAGDQEDMPALLEKIRARYKLTCSVLGIRPRGAEGEGASNDSSQQMGGDCSGISSNPYLATVHGRTVDTNKLNF